MEREDHGHAREERVLRGVATCPVQEGRAGVPVVDVEDIEGHPVPPQARERRPAEDGEAPRIVGVVVEPVPVEGARDVHQAQAIAIGRDIDDRHLDRAAARRIRDPK